MYKLTWGRLSASSGKLRAVAQLLALLEQASFSAAEQDSPFMIAAGFFEFML